MKNYCYIEENFIILGLLNNAKGESSIYIV